MDHTRQPVHVCMLQQDSAGDYVLMLTQEVTQESFQMMQRSPWWGCYMSSPTLEQQSYDTALLYNKSQVNTAGAFEKHNFRNSRMGATTLCTTFIALSWNVSIVGLPRVSSMAQTPYSRGDAHCLHSMTVCKRLNPAVSLARLLRGHTAALKNR